MEVNLRQRVIGGVVLVALAVIFLPLLFKGAAIKSKRVAIETAIPAAPAKPTAQTTITMQGEELNQPRAAVAENNAPDQALLTQNPQGQPVAQRQPIQAMPPKEVEAKAVPNEVPNSQVMNSKAKKAVSNGTSDQQVMNSKAAKVVPNEIPSPQAINAKAADAALAESIAETAPATKPAKTQTNKIYAKVQAKTASNKAKTAANNKTKATTMAANTTKAAKPKVQLAQTVNTTKMTKSKAPLQPAKAWVVQLGSFGDTAKAKTLEKQLRAKGFTAYSRNVKTAIGSMTRVYVGPEVKREKANASLAKLDNDMHIKGVVVAFNPQQVK